MTTTTTNSKDIFPFFELPRELRDQIYESCDGEQPVRHRNGPTKIPPQIPLERRPLGQQKNAARFAKLEEKRKLKKGDAYIAPFDWSRERERLTVRLGSTVRVRFENARRQNFLLVSKQFSREYVERHAHRGRLVVDATPAKYTAARSPVSAIADYMYDLRPLEIIAHPRRIDTVEIRLAMQLPLREWKANFPHPRATFLKALSGPLGIMEPTQVTVKMFIFLAPGSAQGPPPTVPRTLRDVANMVGGNYLPGRYQFGKEVADITKMPYLDRMEFYCQSSLTLPEEGDAEEMTRDFAYVGWWDRAGGLHTIL